MGPGVYFIYFCYTTRCIFEPLCVYEPSFNKDKYGTYSTTSYIFIILWLISNTKDKSIATQVLEKSIGINFIWSKVLSEPNLTSQFLMAVKIY